MTNDPNDPQFEELRKLLALKRYERPPTEFRSEFMHTFRQKRIAEDERRRAWVRRLWLWLTPDWGGSIRSAAAIAVLALLIANAAILPRHSHRRAPDFVTSKHIAAPSAARPASVESNAAIETELDAEASDETYLQAFLMMDDFYNETAQLFSDTDSHESSSAAAEPRSRRDASPMIPVSFSFPTM